MLRYIRLVRAYIITPFADATRGNEKKNEKGMQHRDFPGGHPS